MRRPVFVVVLLVIASLAANTAVCAMARDQEFPAPAVLFMWALAFSQISLLALFLGLGSAAWLERFAALGAGIVSWVWMLVAEEAPPDVIATLLSLHAAAIVFPASLARLAGLRWTDEPLEACVPASTLRPRQLTLARLFAWTTLAAIVAALARNANLPADIEARAYFALLLANNALGAFAATYAVFSYGHAAWCMAGAIVLVYVAGLGLDNFSGSPSQGAQGPFATLNVLQMLLVATSLAVCRTAGLRMIRLGS